MNEVWDSEASVHPILCNIAISIKKTEADVSKWFSILVSNGTENVGSVCLLDARKAREIGFPLRVLDEIKAREKKSYQKQQQSPTTRPKATTIHLLSKHPSGGSVESSFRDLSQFIKPGAKEETKEHDISNKKSRTLSGPGTLRRLLRVERTTQEINTSPRLVKNRALINVIGREGQHSLLIRTSFESKQMDKDLRAFTQEVTVYNQEVELEIHDCSISQALGPSCIIIVFSIYSYPSLTRMLDKWIETSKTQVRIPYLLLVSIDVPTFGVGMHEKIPSSKIKEIASLMKALRYFEVSSKESADEVFLEAARIYIRESQSNPSLATISLLQQACVKNSNHLDLKKRGITLLPSLIYYLSYTVKVVELDNNNLKNFPLEFVYFEQLQELSLSNNQIDEIPLEVSKMSSLVLLNLSYNLIDDIPISNIKQMKSLEELILKGNPLSKIPEEIKSSNESNFLTIIQSFNDRIHEIQYSVFGIPLVELIKREDVINEWRNSPIPRIIRSGVNHLFKYGLSVEGIFRLAGTNVRCNYIRKELERNGVIFSPTEDPHNVASVLKQWLRDLPEPLFLFENFQSIIALAQISPNERVSTLKTIISTLPTENYHLLQQIFRLMYIISLSSSVNKMDVANITKVVGPNLLYTKPTENEDPYTTLNLLSNVNEVLTTVTAFYPEIFEDGVNLFDLEVLDKPGKDLTLYRKYCLHEKSILSICKSSSDEIFWTVDSKCVIRIWSCVSGKVLETIEVPAKRVNCMLSCNDHFWVSTSANLLIFDKSGKLVKEIDVLPYITLNVSDHILIETNNCLLLFSGETFEQIAKLDITYNINHAINVGSEIWIICSDQKLRITDDSFKVLEEVDLNSEIFGRYNKLVQINEDTVWCLGDNKKITIFNAKTRQVKSEFSGFQKGKIFNVFTSCDRVWVTNRNGDMQYYSKSGEYLGTAYPYHTDAISGAVQYYDANFDAYKFFSASWDKSIICWIVKKSSS